MAVAALDLYFGGAPLTKLAQGFTNKFGVPKPLEAPYYTATDNPNIGMEVEYDVSEGSRESAPITNPDSPAILVSGTKARSMKEVGIGANAKIRIGPQLIMMLRAGGMLAMNARREIERQVRDFVKRFDTLDADMVHSAFFRGRIDICANNGFPTIAPTTTVANANGGVIRSIDFGGTTTKNTLTVDGAGGTYNFGNWDDPAFDIVGSLTGIGQYAARNYNFSLTNFYYGPKVPGQLARNTSFKEYLSRNPQFNGGYVSTGQIPAGVMGLQWTPVATATKVLNGTPYSWATDNFRMLTPPPTDTSWYEFIQCGVMVPLGMVTREMPVPMTMDDADFEAAYPVRYGIHAWAKMSDEMVAADLFVSNFKMPVLKSPNAVYRSL